ncbi:hypothetical protein L21TH_2279 [Caldisalinibacter kiritimatiensis]|uniref:Transposase IS4-like domain-containing protein n=1 Tax=Caldisalinibacter kiritimatiensis TaxID=1304284 RepID=R1CBK4_9FIRM|nr:hypothetical protein L21TH_2279 [Caldisalinibacter kiritimatiensis]
MSFFGYKTEFTMLTKEKIITAMNVSDGTYAKEQLERTKEAGIEIEEVYGDKAYFRKNILDTIEEYGAKACIPVSETVYKIDESKYIYNKDADEWYCSQGNRTVKKKKSKKTKEEKESEYLKYYFEIEQCRNCPKHDECAKQQVRKILHISVNTPEFYEISKWQNLRNSKRNIKIGHITKLRMEK